MPTYIGVKNPYGGFGLRSKKPSVAFARVDRLLAQCARDATLASTRLFVRDPCDIALIERALGELPESSTAYRGGAVPKEPPSVTTAAADHVLGDAAAAAFSAFGEPVELGYHRAPDGPQIEWMWSAEDTRDAAFRSHMEFLDQHDTVWAQYEPQVSVRATWTFELADSDGHTECPPSQIHARFSHDRSSAFLELVFRFDEPSSEFWRCYDSVCAALKMKIPQSSLRRVSPTRSGGEKWRKIEPR